MISKGQTVTAGSIVAALALLGWLATTLDVPIPKLAWQSDVERVERAARDEAERVRLYAADVDRLTTENALADVQLRLYRNLAEEDQWKQQGKAPPDYLLHERTDLETKKRRLEQRLQRLQ